MAIQYSKSKHFQGFGECSALKNVNIKETFESFYKTLYKKNKNKLKEKTDKKVIQLEKMKKLKHISMKFINIWKKLWIIIKK